MNPDPAIDAGKPLRPFDQRIRIAALRLCLVPMLPLLAMIRSGWAGTPMAAVLHMAGIGLIVLAVLGRFWAILYIGGRKNATVMRDGPYSICRHPLYLFSTLGAAGFGLLLDSLVAAFVLGGLTFVILSLTATREERFLCHRFGAAYRDYARQVPRILPAPRRFRTAPQITCDTGTLARNAWDALVFLALIPLATVLHGVQVADLLPGLVLP